MIKYIYNSVYNKKYMLIKQIFYIKKLIVNKVDVMKKFSWGSLSWGEKELYILLLCYYY